MSDLLSNSTVLEVRDLDSLLVLLTMSSYQAHGRILEPDNFTIPLS